MTTLRLSLTALGGLLAVNCAACAPEVPQDQPHVVLLYEAGALDQDRIETGAHTWTELGFTFGDSRGLPECERHWDIPADCEVTIMVLADMPHTANVPRYRSNRLTREVAIRADVRGRRRTVEAARAIGNILMDVPDDEQW